MHDPQKSHLETVASLHARAEESLDRHQRWIEVFTARAGRPSTLYALLVVCVVWIALNAFFKFDKPPFAWMELGLTLYASVITTVVLITQTRQKRHAAQRAMLELQVNLLAEQKTAKMIALLEELRRDLPNVRDRADREAEALSRPVDPEVAIRSLEASLAGESIDDGDADRS